MNRLAFPLLCLCFTGRVGAAQSSPSHEGGSRISENARNTMAKGSVPLPLARSAVKKPSSIQWRSFLQQWWFEIAVENGSRVARQPKTRAALKGPFFHDWFSTVAQYPFDRWDDGDSFQTSYIYHPA